MLQEPTEKAHAPTRWQLSSKLKDIRSDSIPVLTSLTTKIIEQADIDVLGGQFRPVTDAIKKQLNINYGLEVLKVNSGALKSAGINRGFIIQKVNDNIVKNIDDLQSLVKKASTSKDPVLYIQGIYPTGKKAYFAVPLSN